MNVNRKAQKLFLFLFLFFKNLLSVVSGVEARMLIESYRVLLPSLISKNEVDGYVFPVIIVPCKHHL